MIHNRLDHGMPLAIDASLRYGLGMQGTRPLTSRTCGAARPTTRTASTASRRRRSRTRACLDAGCGRTRTVDYLYYVRRPNSVRHFFTADEEEFCAKAMEYGYGC